MALASPFLLTFDFALKVPLNVENHVRQHVVGVALNRFVDVAGCNAGPLADGVRP